MATIHSKRVKFTETDGAGVYTGRVSLPAGALIHNIKLWSTALWTAATSATMKVGDADDDDGFFTGVNLKATDLLVEEEIDFENFGGKQGAYLVDASGTRNAYRAAARIISGVVTTVGTTGDDGRTFMEVSYSRPFDGSAKKVAS